MSSPRHSQQPAAIGTSRTQPLTPPADPPNSSNPTANNASSVTTTAGGGGAQNTSTKAANKDQANTNNSNATAAPAPPAVPPSIPATSLSDTGKSRRPRDVRLIHMLLASQGVSAYQERVPLQLLDFAYRYTSSTLQDAVYLAMEGYVGSNNPNGIADGSAGAGAGVTTAGGGRGGGGGGNAGGNLEVSSVTLQALRLSIASRLHYQFQSGLPKEFLLDIASERNRIALPGVTRGGFDGTNTGSGATGSVAGSAPGGRNAFSSVSMGGVRLPPERFCLTGVGWNLKEEWESEGEEDMEELNEIGGARTGVVTDTGAGTGVMDDDEDEDEGDGRMEDIFGEDTAMGDGGDDEDEDKTMADA